MDTILNIICMYCKKKMGEKPGFGTSGDSHSICRDCWSKYFPEWDYPEEEKELE